MRAVDDARPRSVSWTPAEYAGVTVSAREHGAEREAGAGGPIPATLPVERPGEAAAAVDRRAGGDVPAHLHPAQNRRGAAEAHLPGNAGLGGHGTGLECAWVPSGTETARKSGTRLVRG